MAVFLLAAEHPTIYLFYKVWSNVSCALEAILLCALLTFQKRSISLTVIYCSVKSWKVVGMVQSLTHWEICIIIFYFHVKRNCLVSSNIFSKLEVNQGGVTSGLLFHIYIAVLDSYLSIEHGVCIGNEIVAHLLWAHDLILFSDTFHGLQE